MGRHAVERAAFGILAILPVAGCGQHGSPASATKAITDVVSMQQEPNGSFDVVCKDGTREIVTADQVQQNNVCPSVPPAPPPGGHIAQAADRNIGLPSGVSGQIVATLGQGLWEGYASFTLTITSDYAGDDLFVLVKDGVGGTWRLDRHDSVVFNRLALPVTFVATTPSYDSSSFIAMAKSTFEITKTNPIVEASAFKGRADKVAGITTIGTDIPGVKMAFVADATFYKNFTNDNFCDQLTLTGVNKTVTLDAAHPNVSFSDLTAPLSIWISPTCQSSRLPTPENADHDFELTIPVIQLGDPV